MFSYSYEIRLKFAYPLINLNSSISSLSKKRTFHFFAHSMWTPCRLGKRDPWGGRWPCNKPSRLLLVGFTFSSCSQDDKGWGTGVESDAIKERKSAEEIKRRKNADGVAPFLRTSEVGERRTVWNTTWWKSEDSRGVLSTLTAVDQARGSRN